MVFYKEAIKKQKTALGEMHCDTHASEIDLAFCYIDLKDPEVEPAATFLSFHYWPNVSCTFNG